MDTLYHDVVWLSSRGEYVVCVLVISWGNSLISREISWRKIRKLLICKALVN